MDLFSDIKFIYYFFSIYTLYSLHCKSLYHLPIFSLNWLVIKFFEGIGYNLLDNPEFFFVIVLKLFMHDRMLSYPKMKLYLKKDMDELNSSIFFYIK